MRSVLSRLLIGALVAGLLAAPAQALPTSGMRSVAASQWAYLYAGTKVGTSGVPAPQANEGTPKSTFIVNYSFNFPTAARTAFDKAVAIWSQNFASPVPIVINATWSRLDDGVLGSARPTRFFTNFDNAPARDLWYTPAMANALAGRDLDPSTADITANFTSAPSITWSFLTSGVGYPGYYDFVTVVLHEIGHGLGFLSNTYKTQVGDYVNDQPTPFDALVQPSTTDAKLADLQGASNINDLGTALTSPMTWVGVKGVAANGGLPPKIYSPSTYERGSSTSHLDESTYNSTPNALMTPVLNTNEVIYDPGPIVLAIFADMMSELPASKATVAPSAPKNASAITGEGSAIVSFDPPLNNRNSQVEDYTVSVVGNSVPAVTAKTSPVTVTGLRPGMAYVFTVKANNAIGSSPLVYTNSVLVSKTWNLSTIDGNATAENVATATWRGQPVIAYTDTKSGDLRLALWNGKKWQISTVDGNSTTGGRTNNAVTGQLSLCVTGSKKSEKLEIFYSDLVDRDLRHATYDGKAFSFEIVDGNAAMAQKVEDPIRVRTSDDVSVSNACAATSDGLQVFYRDETLGILLGAVKKGGSWKYELIDGDRDSDSRTTGDVGFRLEALTVGRTIHLVYDSYFSFDAQRNPLSGDVRYAVRTGAAANSWKYFYLQQRSPLYPVAGYDVAIGLNGNRIFASWLAATPTTSESPVPDTLRIAEITAFGPVGTRTVLPNGFGKPSAPLSISGNSVSYGCAERLCSANLKDGARALVTGQRIGRNSTSMWLSALIGKTNKIGVVLSINGKLSYVTK